MISRLSVRLSSIADNGGLGGGVAGRCRQIRIWLHRAGRARSQKREMKFDRSDRDPLAFGSSILVSKPPVAAPPSPPRLRLSRSSRHPVATSRAAKWCWHAHPPGFRTFGVPHGHRRAPPSLAHVVPPLLSPLSRVTHPILYDSLLSVTSLPPPPPPPPVMLPRGHPLKRVSLVPTRHLFTNTSHGLLAPCRVSTPGPIAPTGRIAVPS